MKTGEGGIQVVSFDSSGGCAENCNHSVYAKKCNTVCVWERKINMFASRDHRSIVWFLALYAICLCAGAIDHAYARDNGEQEAGRPTIEVPSGEPPAIDGEVASEEWDDALVVREADDPWDYDAMAEEADPQYGAEDLACEVRMKHDGDKLYVLVIVVDDVIYNVDTEEWSPTDAPGRSSPYWDSDSGRQDWGWWGDSFELAICANMDGECDHFPFTGPCDPEKPGEAWKIQGNASYSRLMVGEELEEWKDNERVEWDMELTEDPRGYVQEWSIALNPCLDTGQGDYYQPGSEREMGLQIMILDNDRRKDGEGNWSSIHHQAVWSYAGSGSKKDRENWGRLILEEAP